MATDLERLVVQMSADFKSYETAFAKASGVTRQQLAIIKADAANTGKASEAAFTGASRGVQRFGQQAQAARGGVQNLRLQTANLGAQFQDIAVQLQSGTSPFTIALQQGTQISSVLGGAGAGGAVKALGAAFASLVSPVSLITIGLIAAGGAAVQYFSSLLGSGEDSAKELERQADLIQQVAKEWGDALPQVRAYADEVKRAAEVADILDATAIINAQAYDNARERVAALADQLVVLRGDVEAVAGPAQINALSALQSAFSTLEEKTLSNTATAEDAKAVQDALAAVMDIGGAAAAAFAGGLDVLAGSLVNVAAQTRATTAATEALIASTYALNNVDNRALAKAARIYEDRKSAAEGFIQAQTEENALTADQLRLQNLTNQYVDEGIENRAEALRLAEQTIAADARRAAEAKAAGASGGGGGGAAKDIDRERESVTKLIEQLEYESTLIGKTALEKEKMNALRRAGTAATPEEIAWIKQRVEASYLEIEALQKTEDQMNRLKDVSRDVLGGLFEDLRDGVQAADLLANALNRVVEAMTQSALDKVIEGAFAGGNPFGNPFARTAAMPPATYVPGRLYHGGGIAGQGPAYPMPAAWFANAPKFHGGGEVPALLLPGERVLSKRESAGYGGDVTVQVFNAPAGTQVQESKGPDGKRLIKVMLKPALQELMSDGSMDGTMRSNFGVRRRPR